MINWTDWVLWLLYFTIFYMVVLFYRKTKESEVLYKYYLKGFVIKVMGGVIFALVSIYYYGGDTILYFSGAKELTNYFLEDPGMYFQLLFSGDIQSSEFSGIVSRISYAKTAEEWFMVKILSVFCLLSCQSYLVVTLFMSSIAFWGGWILFRVFTSIAPNSERIIFVSIFLMPSLLFWGTGVLKDTITLALINFLIYTVFVVLEKKRYSLFLIFLSMIASAIIYFLKSYVLLAFLPALIYIVYAYFKNSISSQIAQIVLVPIIFIFFFVFGFFTIQKLTENTVYSTQNIKTHVRGFHTWHTTTGGSSYNLGEVDFTVTGVVKKVPAALNVSFFRPYLWEARNLTSLIGAIESSVILLAFIFIVLKVWISFVKKLRESGGLLGLILISFVVGLSTIGITTYFETLSAYKPAAIAAYGLIILMPFFRVLRSNKFLWGLMIFVLIFGFAIGFTSYNFGALSRYKMPIISVYVFALVYVYKRNKALN